MGRARISARAVSLAIAVALLAAHAGADEGSRPPAVISLEAAIQLAMARNPQALTVVEEIRRAEALVRQVRSGALPTLTGNGSYTRLDAPRVSGGLVVAGQDQLAGNLTLLAPIVAARSWVQWSHARDNVEVSKLAAAEVRRQLSIAVARTYLSLVAQHRVVEVTERAQVAAKAHYEFAHARFAGGYGTRVDEVRAAQELATDRSQVEAAHAQLTRLRESLGVLLGVDSGVEVETEVVLPAPPPAAVANSDAPKLRTDIRLFQLKLSAAHHVRRDDWADYLPALSASFVPFVQSPPTPILPSSGWQAQLVLTVPLYDGGLRYGQANERAALEREARLGLEGGLRQLESDVRVALEEVRRAEAALDAAREAARLAEDGLALSNLGYRAGASTNIEVIDAERRARDAATAVAVAEDADRQGLLDFLIASGRFPGR